MTREQAKRELRPLKDMAKDIKSIEDEIERLMAVATKMTPNYDITPVSGTPKNKMEEALMQIEEYKGRLSKALLEDIEYRNKCRDKIEKIEPKSLQNILVYYYFQNFTLEKTAELMERSVRWTYEMFTTALDKYSEIS